MKQEKEFDTLKIDLDAKSVRSAINRVKDRLSYMHDLAFLNVKNIKEIRIITKTNSSVKIFFKKKCFNANSVVMMQLLFGSDYRKEINTLINYHYLKMQYFNRMFDVKRYKDGTIKTATYYDATEEIIKYVLSKKRKQNRN